MRNRGSLPGLVMLVFAIGALAIAILDVSFRPKYADLASVAIGGFFGHLLPQGSRHDG